MPTGAGSSVILIPGHTVPSKYDVGGRRTTSYIHRGCRRQAAWLLIRA
jgi:hypothetical protein